MGTWGPGPFENDDAADWLCDLSETGDLQLAREALDAVVAVGVQDYLQAPLAGAALAAAVVVAGCTDPTLSDLTYAATVWLERSSATASAADRDLALAAVYRILGPNSEVVDLHREVGAQEGIDTIARIGIILQAQIG